MDQQESWTCVLYLVQENASLAVEERFKYYNQPSSSIDLIKGENACAANKCGFD
jgi:hypothetical protein